MPANVLKEQISESTLAQWQLDKKETPCASASCHISMMALVAAGSFKSVDGFEAVTALDKHHSERRVTLHKRDDCFNGIDGSKREPELATACTKV